MITVAIAAILASVAIPGYQAVMNKSRTAEARRELMAISMAMERYYTRNGRFPADLTEITNRPDPWGNAYAYLNMEGASVGQKRKDKSLHPLNSDYDLYSMGPDGQSATPLTARASRDDVIRANNGSFFGVAEDY